MFNNMLIGAAGESIKSTGGFQVANSAMFNKADAEYLDADSGFGTPSNADIGTLSMWFKRANLGDSNLRLFTHGSGGSVQIQAYFTSSNTLVVGNGTEVTTTQLFRDPHAWYHLVVRVDTSQGTAADRVRVYLNGSQITDFSASSYPSQNADIFTSTGWRIGSWSGSTTHTFDGYMAEVVYCDGQSLAPTSFGETDDNGVWRPIDVSGLTFGNNGFYLNFASSGSDLGDDASGNSNDFTNNNSVTQTTDTCTDNHATFSPLLSNASKVTLSEGNMRGASSTSSGHVGLIVSGFELPTAGKYYWEWVVNTVGTTPALGWRSIENLNPNGHSSGGNNQADFITGNDYNTGDGRILSSTIDGSTSLSQAAYGNFLTVSGGNPLANGTVLGCAYDADNGLAWFSYNDSWVDGNGTDNSATVKGEIEAGTSGSQAFTTANGAVGEAGLHIKAVSNSVSSFNYTLRTRSDQWTGTCPTGFTAVSTKNQAAAVTYAIEDGSTSFQTTLYTGNGASSHEINQSGETSTFAPDFLWTKGRTLTEHRITDIIRGATKVFFTDSSLGNSASTTETTSVLSLDSDGFTVGSGGGVNGSGQAKLAWQWKAGDSNTTVSASGSGDGAINACTHRANQTAGFSLVKYEGANSQISNGQDTKVTHGLGAKPELALIKNMDDTHDWMVLSTSTTGFASDSQTGDDAHLHLNTDDNINGSLFTGHFETGSDSTHFEVGNDNGVNKNGDNYMAYLFRSIPGYTKVGSYTGGTNSTNGVYVDLGFSPAWLMLKNYKNSGESWYVFDNQRPGYNDENNQLIPNSTAAEGAGNILDLLSNGFKIRANDRAYGGSSSSDGYLYLAFAENPFAGTTPATAR